LKKELVENFPSALPMLCLIETGNQSIQQHEIIPEWFKNLSQPFPCGE
jgi:hypothetical protein